MFEMEAMTLLGVNDLQKYNTNNKATFYILLSLLVVVSLSLSVGGRIGEMNEMIDEVCVVCLRRRRQCDDDDDGR